MAALAGVLFLADPRHGGRALDGAAELAAFPSGKALPVLRLGHAQLAADVGWLRAIQYYGEHRRGDRIYPHADHIFRIITGLDPRFEMAYVFGALVLAEDAGDDLAARELLTRGMAARPDSWWIAFERGFLQWISGGDTDAAARDMQRASRLPNAPAWVGRFAAHTYELAGKPATAAALWKEIAEETDNPQIRDIALRAVKKLEGAAAEGEALRDELR
jgi:hypothetical protein